MFRHPFRWAREHRGAAAAIAVVGVAVLVAGVVWFEPHKLFIDDRVDEAVPGGGSVAMESPGASPASPASPVPGEESPGPPPSDPPEEPPAGPAVLSRGDFRSLEHETTGEAVLLETTEGLFVRFEDLNTSNGPDLRVYLSELDEEQGWYDADDAAYVDLGALKGNQGNQNYEIPAGVDVSGFRSVVIWCRRFTVGFGVAPISVSG